MSDAVPPVTGDMPANHWIDRYAPAGARPYLKLARIDRPIGTWLLLWPCWWSLALAAPHSADAARPGWAALGWLSGGWPNPVLFVLFGLGALVMRAAGCTWNDIRDRDLDARVARTRSRPIAAGQVSLARAFAFMVALGLTGLVILLGLNRFAVGLGIAALLPAFIYPFAKRFTHWPQAFLGVAFNWGALLGWAAVTGGLAAAPFALYVAGIGWTLGYDTIYAHQDKEDDAIVGVKSSAILLGERTRPWLAAFYIVTVAGLAAAGWLAGIGWLFYAGLALAAAHLARQVVRVCINDAANCLAVFRSNRNFGWIVFASLVAGSVTA
jgi:4-hydroxybenzoate polyprenyltransferase